MLSSVLCIPSEEMQAINISGGSIASEGTGRAECPPDSENFSINWEKEEKNEEKRGKN